MRVARHQEGHFSPARSRKHFNRLRTRQPAHQQECGHLAILKIICILDAFRVKWSQQHSVEEIECASGSQHVGVARPNHCSLRTSEAVSA